MSPKLFVIPLIFVLLFGTKTALAVKEPGKAVGCDTMALGKVALAARKSFLEGNKEQAFLFHICALQRFSQGDAGIHEFINFHNTFSTTLRLVGAHELSAEHARKAFEIAKNYHRKGPAISRAMTTYGNQMLLNGYADSALHYYRLRIPSKAKNINIPMGSSTCNNIGMCYAELGQYDSAKVYYNKAMQRLKGNQSEDFSYGLYLAIFDNIIRCLWKSDKIKERMPLIDSFRTECLTHGTESRQIRCELLLGEIALDLENYDELQKYIEKLSTLTDQKNRFSNGRYQHQYESLFLGLYTGTGQLAEANYYSKRVLKTSDSLAMLNKEFLELMLKAQPYYDNASEKIELRLARVEVDKAKSLLKQDTLQKWLKTVTVFALIVLLSVVIITLFFKNRQQALETEKQQISAEVEAKEQKLSELEKEIDLRKTDLESFTLYLNVLKETREDVKKTIERSIQQTEEDGKQTLRQLLRKDKTAELMEERTDVLYNNVESISAGFYERLRTTYPELSPAEMELCAYLRAGLTNGEIAQRRNIQTKSVRMTKYRLKKKLALPESTDIYEFIRKF